MTGWALVWAVLPYAALVVFLFAGCAGLYLEALGALIVPAALGSAASCVWIFVSRPGDWFTALLLVALAVLSPVLMVLLAWAAFQAHGIAQAGVGYWSRAGALVWAWVTRSCSARAVKPSPVSGAVPVRMLVRLPPNRVADDAWAVLLKGWNRREVARFARLARRPGTPDWVWLALAMRPEDEIRLAVQGNAVAPDAARVAAALRDPNL